MRMRTAIVFRAYTMQRPDYVDRCVPNMVDLPQHKLSVVFSRKPLRHQRQERVLVDDDAALGVIDERHNGRWHWPASSAVDGQRWLVVVDAAADNDAVALLLLLLLSPTDGGDLRSHRGA